MAVAGPSRFVGSLHGTIVVEVGSHFNTGRKAMFQEELEQTARINALHRATAFTQRLANQ